MKDNFREPRQRPAAASLSLVRKVDQCGVCSLRVNSVLCVQSVSMGDHKVLKKC